MMNNCKLCFKCQILKNEEDFSKSEFKKNTPKCRNCCKEYSKLYYINNKLKVNERNNEYYLNNKNDVIEKQREYYKINKEKKLSQQKIYLLNNRKKRNIYYNNYIKNKKINNVCFKIKRNISASIYINLIKNNYSKNHNSCLKYLKYSMKELKEHLENLFEPWMNWQNWGVYNPNTWEDNNQTTWKWQIDHIIPHSKFNYTSMEDEEFKKCWALNNLRPYSAKQNIIDNNRRNI